MLLPRDDDSLFAALLARDPAYEGFAYAGVTTTGVFCRLTCPARKPRRDHVRFFASADEAQAAGFRPCLRCRPLDRGRPVGEVVEGLKARVGAEPDRRWSGAELRSLGYDPSTVRRAFQREYGVTFSAFARSRRLGAGVHSLQQGVSVMDAQLDAGYESGSGFREAITRLIGDAPARAALLPTLAARWLDTPIGAMLAVADEAGLHLLEFLDRTALPREIDRLKKRAGPICFRPHPVLDTLARELDAYYAGRSPCFGTNIAQRGSAFEAEVWRALQAIPPGATRSYGEVARLIGRPDAVRAVARANGANQVAVLVPCHRVIGADGALTGYGGKIWRKRWLLEHESRMAGSARPAA